MVGDLCYRHKSDTIDVPVKSRRSASLSLEDLVSSQFSWHKYREKSVAGAAEFVFHDYNDYAGLGYELELITSPEQVQSTKQVRRRQRRENKRKQEEARRQAEEKAKEKQKKQEAALQREEARRVREEAQKQQEREEKKAADLEAFVKTVSEKAATKIYDDLDQNDSLSEAHAAQRHTIIRNLAREFGQSQSGALEHEVIVDGYLSDEELDYDLTKNKGTGLDFGTEADHLPSVGLGAEVDEEEKKEAAPQSSDDLVALLLHKQQCAQNFDKQERTLQRSLYKMLQEGSGYLAAWENILSADDADPAIQAHLQAHLQDWHAHIQALPKALNAWKKSLQDWEKLLATWANSLHQPTESAWSVSLDAGDYQDNLDRCQAAKKVLTCTQDEYQAFLQAASAWLHTPHYHNALTTPQLQKQAMVLAQTLVPIANHAAVATEQTLQQAEHAYQKAQSRDEKARDQLEAVRKKLVRKQVVVMAHTLDHQPLLDYLAGEGRKYINEKDDQGKTALQYVIARHQLDVVQWLLDHGADKEVKDEDGLTPLHRAAQDGHTATVALLLAHGAAIDAKDKEGLTPLHRSAINDHTATAKLLIAHDAAVAARDQWGYTPLHQAVLQGNLATVVVLLDAANTGIDAKDVDRCTPLHCAVQQGHVDIVELLLVHGADRKAKNQDGFTPLRCAVQLGYTDILKVLLYHISDIKNQDVDRFTLLHLAAEQGHKAIVELLLKKGLAIDAKDAAECTPLHWAVKQGHSATVALLLTRGAAIEAKDAAGCTPLHWAAEQSHPAITELLLVRGADLNARNTHGQTPHTLARAKGHQLEDPYRKALCKKVKAMAQAKHHWPLLYYLAGKGCRYLNEKDAQGHTALWHAIDQNDPAIVQWLLDHGADVEAKTRGGDPPLHWAVKKGHKDIVTLLLRYDAAIEAKGTTCTALHTAVQEGHTDTVILLLDQGAKIDAQDIVGFTPLHYAARKGHTPIVAMLLNKGAHIEAKGLFECTPLYDAIQGGHKDVVALLLDHGAIIEARDKEKSSPLHYAVMGDDKDIVLLLLANGADITASATNGTTPFDIAATKNHDLAALLKKEMHQRAVVAARTLGQQPLLDYLAGEGHQYINEKDKQGKTALQHAIARHQLDVVRWLLDHGADKEVKDEDGLAPLHWAVKQGHTAAVALLLDRGVNIEAKNNRVSTPLHFAAQGGHTDTVKLLLGRDADIEAKNNSGSTPLHFAAQGGHTDTVKLLLDRGAVIEAKNNSGTPLYFAVVNGHKDTVKLLLDRGVNKEAKNNSGRTVLHEAALHGHKDTVELLLDRDVNIESKVEAYRRGCTPLHLATGNGHTAVVKLLLDRSANVERKNGLGCTPLHEATTNGHTTTSELLLIQEANIEAKDNLLDTPLHWAAYKGHIAIIELLLAYDAPIDIQNRWGYTPLHRAAIAGNIDAVRLLLYRSADSTLKDSRKKTALDLAISNGYKEVATLLRAAQAPGWKPCSPTAAVPPVVVEDVTDAEDDEATVEKEAGHDAQRVTPTTQPSTGSTTPTNVKDAPELAQAKAALPATVALHKTVREEPFNIPINYKGLPNVGNTCYLNAGLQVMARLYPDLFNDNQNHATPTVRYAQPIIDKLIHQDATERVTIAESIAFRDALIRSYNVGKGAGDQLRKNEQEDAAPVWNFLLAQGKATEVALYRTRTKVHPEGRYTTKINREPATGPALVLPAEPAPMPMDQLVADTLHGERVADVIWEHPEGKQETRGDALVGDRLSMANLHGLNNRILPIWVHRFGQTDNTDAGTAEKINTSITNPFSLTIPAEHLIEQVPYTGKLVGFIHHEGTLHGGHYTTYIRHQSGDWVCYNDATVTALDSPPLQEAQGAYLYFYQAVDSINEAVPTKDVVSREAPQTLQVPAQPTHTPLSTSTVSTPLTNVKDAPELAQAKAALQATLAIQKVAQEDAKAAAQDLVEAQAATTQAKYQSQASLTYLQTMEQHVARLADIPPVPRCVNPYLQAIVKEAKAYLHTLAETDEVVSENQKQQGNRLFSALYARRQQEQQHYRHADQLFLYDDTLSEYAQVKLLGEVLPQHQYHIDTLNDLLDKLAETGHAAPKNPAQKPSRRTDAQLPVVVEDVTDSEDDEATVEKEAGHDAQRVPHMMHASAPSVDPGVHTQAINALPDEISEQNIAVLRRIVRLGVGLPVHTKKYFQEKIAPTLEEKLLLVSPALQEKVFYYFEKQGAFYLQVIRQHPVQDWVCGSLCYDLAQGTPLSDALHDRFHTLTAKCKRQYPAEILEAILWMLQDKKEAHALSLAELCDVVEILPEDGTQARTLLQLPADHWRTALKNAYFCLRVEEACPYLNIDQCQSLAKALSHLNCSRQATQTLLARLPQDHDPEALSRLLAFAAQYPIDEDQFVKVLTTSTASADKLIAHWHQQLACCLIKEKLSKFLPQAAQESTYRLIKKLWAHTPMYQAITTFLEQLYLRTLQEDSAVPATEHLHRVLSMMHDYRLDEATYTTLLKQLVDLPAHQWQQHFYTQILQHCFGEEVHERTVAEIIAYMAQHSPEVAYVQDQAKLAQAHQNVLDAYQKDAKTCPGGHPIASWEADTVTKWCQTVKDYAKNSEKGTLPTQYELIAVVKRAVVLHHGYSPRNTQLLSLLVLLNATQDQGRLLQINTGEGKSLIVAIFSAIQTLLNNKSDIVTTSTELSIPEVAKQRPFFKMLALSVAENSTKGAQDANKKKREAYQQDNVYGTPGDFQGDILRTEFFGQEMRMQRPDECVIVDEVDNMLFDSRTHSIRLPGDMPAMNHLTLLLATVWHRVNYWSKHFIVDQGKYYFIEEDFEKDEDGHITILSGENRDPQQCMHLYEGDVEEFIKDTVQKDLDQLLRDLNEDEQAAYAARQKLEREMVFLRTEVTNTSDPDACKTKEDKLTQLAEDYQALPWNANIDKYPPIVSVPAHLKQFAKQCPSGYRVLSLLRSYTKKGIIMVYRVGR
jgi:ankyrin repeat protein